MSFFGSRIRSTWVRLVFSSAAILFLESLGELPRDDLFHRLRLRLFEDALLLEEVIDAGTHMLLAHRSNSFWRFRAVVKSSSGVDRVFLMNPCNATRCSRERHTKIGRAP